MIREAQDILILIGAGKVSEALAKIEGCTSAEALEQVLSALMKINPPLAKFIDAIRKRLSEISEYGNNRGGKSKPTL